MPPYWDQWSGKCPIVHQGGILHFLQRDLEYRSVDLDITCSSQAVMARLVQLPGKGMKMTTLVELVIPPDLVPPLHLLDLVEV